MGIIDRKSHPRTTGIGQRSSVVLVRCRADVPGTGRIADDLDCGKTRGVLERTMSGWKNPPAHLEQTCRVSEPFDGCGFLVQQTDDKPPNENHAEQPQWTIGTGDNGVGIDHRPDEWNGEVCIVTRTL